MIVKISILSICLTAFFYFLLKEYTEINFLKKILTKIIGKEKIENVEDLIKIKNFLNNTISYNSDLKTKKRPLLRHTSTEILNSGYGFCGENARVAIKLMLLGGIKARRIYLFRKEWQHVLIEHEWKNKWYMFDGHYDKDTLLQDSQVASIPSENIENFPNNYPNNPYLDFCSIKLFQKITLLNPFSKIKIPIVFVYLMESPNLIKTIFAFIVLSVVCLLFLT